MLNSKPSRRALAVLFPFVLLLAWTISVQMSHDRGDVFRLKIVGYDPVDLLSGHYLRFRYDLGKVDLCKDIPNKMATCACLKPAEQGTMEAEYSGGCESLQTSCQTILRGNCQDNTFLTFSERFYFPEEYTSVLALVPPDSQAEVKISKEGAIALQKIFVKDKDILDYAKERIRSPDRKN